MRFLLGVTPSVQSPGFAGGHRGVAVLRGGGSQATISAAIHFPPFSILLAEHELAGLTPRHADCTDWLSMDVNESHSRFSVVLPAVQTRGSQLTFTGAFEQATI